MVQSDNWTERFRISDKDLSQAMTLEATGDPLRWCLMNGKIPEIEYLEWAMRKYELPSINSDFFTAPPDHAFWKRVKPLYHWHEGFFPVSEWDGMLLIACLSPPENFKLTQPHKFILASARHLLLLWNHLNPEEELQKPAQMNPEINFSQIENKPHPFEITNGTEIPEGFSFSVALTSNSSGQASKHGEPDFGAIFASSINAPIKTEDSADSSSFGHSENSLITEMPEGFSGVGFASSSKKPEDPNNQAAHTSFEFELPENIIVQTPSSQQAPHNEPVRTTEKSPLKQSGPQVAVRSAPPPPIGAEAQTATITELPNNSIVKISGESVSQPNSMIAVEELEEDHSDKNTHSKSDSSFVLSSVSLRPLDATVSQDDLGAVSLSHILQNFNGAMVLIMEDGILKPWKWSDLLTGPKNDMMNAILLDTPSIFRIVAQTKLPYHGYVRPSEVNDAFFNAFQNGKTPPHVTITPVKVKGVVCAMLLGLMVKGTGTHSMLSQMENLADDFAKTLIGNKRSSAA